MWQPSPPSLSNKNRHEAVNKWSNSCLDLSVLTWIVMERSSGVCAPQGRRNFYSGRLNGSQPAQIGSDSPDGSAHDPLGRRCRWRNPGGVDEAWASVAAGLQGAHPCGLRYQEIKSLNLGENLFQGPHRRPHHRRFIDSSLPYSDLRGPRLISSRDFSILTPTQQERGE